MLQKAMVLTLTVAMLVGTPLTASAAPLNGVFSVSDGNKPVVKDDNPTGTITNTDTNTGFLTNDNRAEIVGIALDKQTVKTEVGVQETLKATVILNGTIKAGEGLTDKQGNSIPKDTDITDLVVKEMSEKIHWELMYTDQNGKKLENKPNPADKVGIGLTAGNATDRSMITLTPYHGTKIGEEVTVRATIDASYYFDAEGNKDTNKTWENRLSQDKKLTEGKEAFYTADAKVSVKEFSEKLLWTDTKESAGTSSMYAKHTLDLSEKLGREPETANDDITWVSDNTQVATVSAAGIVTAKKAGTVEITAVGEHGAKATRTVTVEQGTQASKIIIVASKSNLTTVANNEKTLANQTVDLGLLGDKAPTGAWTTNTKEVFAKVYAKVKNVVVKKADNSLVTSGTADEIKENLGNNTYKTVSMDLPDGTKYITATKTKNVWTVVSDNTVKVDDVITWSSNKGNIVSVTAGTDGSEVMKAEGVVGSAAITAKASGGKSVKVNVTVKGTLGTLTIGGFPADKKVYSGQTIQLTDGRTPAGSKDGVKWSIEKVTKVGGTNKINNPNATINNKGVLKIANNVDTNYPIVIHLESAKKYGPKGSEETIKATNQDVTLTPVQSSIENITVNEIDLKGNKTPVAYGGFADGTKVSSKLAKSETSKLSIPLNKSYEATVTATNGMTLNTDALSGLLTWKTSNAKIAQLSADSGKNVTIKAVGTGTATITVSGVRQTPPNKNGKTSASVISVKFKVLVKQPAETLTMNKPAVTLAYKERKVGKDFVAADQNVALKVTFGPKKADAADKKIEKWTVKNVKTNEVTTITSGKGNNVKNVTALSATAKLIAPKVGDEYIITAKSITGMTATSTVKIVSPTQSAKFADGNELVDKTYGSGNNAKTIKEPKAYNRNTKEMTVGGTEQLYPYINIGKDAKQNADWKKAGDAPKDGGYITEGVTYSVNKKGIVTVDSNGKVYAVKKGNVTITATTGTGKKATLKVTVK